MLGLLYICLMFNERGKIMTVGELLELLEQYPKDVEVLVDCKSTDDVVVYIQKGYYLNNDELVVHIDV